ncbi:hypothetical protein IRJ41_001082, partial [Triplophysa rosa]
MEQRRPHQWLERHVEIFLIALSLVFGRMVLAQVRYSISEEQKDGAVVGNIAKDLGIDHRTLKERGFRIVSTSGESLFIVNQNDVSANGSAEGVEEIPRNVNAGHLVTKVRAYDADIGYNGWLLFSLQEVSDHSLFSLDRYTGQIRTLRSFTETDEAQHKLVILVKDNGNVSLSATATVIVKVVEPKEAFAASDVKNAVKDEEENNVTFYLIITLGSVSVLFITSIIVLIVMQCSKSTDYSSKYLQDTNYDGTLCHSIQYRSGDKRYMLVGPRMSIGSTLAPGSNRNTLVIPDRRRRDSEEEQKDGAVVGNLAKDLGLDLRSLKERGFRIVTTSGDSLFTVNQIDGMLNVNGKIDRETVCERIIACIINLKIALENPLEIHYVSVEIVDVNDHAPTFPEKEKRLEISESALPGARYQLQAARDPDSATNSVQQYKLSHNDHFRIEIKDRGEDRKMPFLVLQKALDRETTSRHKLLLTALDGGRPPKTGTMEIIVDVLDVNDNMPVFTQDVYSVTLKENVPVGTIVVQVNATDMDDGTNGEIFYTFGSDIDSKLLKLFDLNSNTGEITVIGPIDYEETNNYDIDIQASDKGPVNYRLTSDKSITIKIIDVNDNAPEIEVTSFSSAVPEDSK